MVEPLTPREKQIARLVANGFTNAEIADKICVTPDTVKKYMTNIFGKTCVRNRTELAVWFLKRNTDASASKKGD